MSLLDSTELNPKFRLAADIPPGGEKKVSCLPWKPRAALGGRCPRGVLCADPQPHGPAVHSSVPITASPTQGRPLVNAAGGITTIRCHPPHYTEEETEAQSIKVHITAEW